MLLHFDIAPDAFRQMKHDDERERWYFASADPLVLIRLDVIAKLEAGTYWDASLGWDRGDAGYVAPENVGRRHTKITLRKCYGQQPPAQFDPSEFRTLSQILADAPRQARRFDPAEISGEVIGQLRNHITRLGMRVYVGGVLPQAHDTEWCELQAEIEELCRIANGEIRRESASEDMIAETHQLIQDIAELCAPYYAVEYTIPADWRKTRLGQAWDAARFWLLSNDMISLSDAARILYDAADTPELSKLDRAIARGDLDEYLDPNENNPRKARRVLKSQVKALLRKRDR